LIFIDISSTNQLTPFSRKWPLISIGAITEQVVKREYGQVFTKSRQVPCVTYLRNGLLEEKSGGHLISELNLEPGG